MTTQQEPRWLSDKEQAFWRKFLLAMRKVQHGIDRDLQTSHGLTTPEFAVLVNLSEAMPDQEMRLRDLCLALDWGRSRTSHQVTRMEKRGLLSKRKCPEDGRGIVIGITEDGMSRLVAAAPDHVESVCRIVFDQIDENHLAPVEDFFDRIIGDNPNMCSDI